MIIFGITGTLGAGKGTIVEFLQQKYQFKHYSVRDYLTREMTERGLSHNRDNLVAVANDLRAKYGPSYLAEQLYEAAFADGTDAVIESLRTPGEVASLKSKGEFYLLAVDAEPQLRYARILERKSMTDNVSFEDFLNNEARELESKDPNKQNILACVAMADFSIMNNGSIANLHEQIEKAIAQIKSKRNERR